MPRYHHIPTGLPAGNPGCQTWASSYHSKISIPRQNASIEKLVSLVAADMQRVNAMILSRTGSDVTMIPEVANHLISSGGKRLRPMLTLATAGLSGYAGDGHVKLAAAVEFMHTATLLHDDVVDESDMRRGKHRRAHQVGQRGERARRRLPARPGLPHDGRGRLAAAPSTSCPPPRP